MAITWGNWYRTQYGTQLQVGVETVVSGTAIGVYVYWRANAGYRIAVSHASLNVSGGTSYSSQVALNGSGDSAKSLWSTTFYVTRQRGYATTGSVTATLSGYGGSSTVSVSYSVEAESYNLPAPPSNLVARFTDSDNDQVLVTWDAYSSGSAPIESIQLARKLNEGDWQYFTLDASTRSYADSSYFPSDSRIAYTVATLNSGGSSGFVGHQYLYTKPDTPTNFSCVLKGSDVVLSWSNYSRYATYVQVWDGDTYIGSTSDNTYRISSPSPYSTHKYRLRTAIYGIYSDWTASREIGVLAPPYAPTSLVPNGTPVASGARPVASWEYHSGDGTAQTKFEIEIFSQYSNTWKSEGVKYSDKASYELPSEIEEKDVKWRVRVWGKDPNKPSDWSAPATYSVVLTPTVQIVNPQDGVAIRTSSVDVDFTSSATPPVFYRVILTNTASGEQKTVTGTGEGAQMSVNFPDLLNNTRYKVSAEVLTKVWSDPATVTFMTRLPELPAPTMDASWVEDDARAQLTVSNIVQADFLTISRILPDGARAPIVEEVPVSSLGGAPLSYSDVYPSLSGKTTYEVKIWNKSGQQATATASITPIRTRTHASIVSKDGTISATVRWNPETTRSTGLYNAETIYMLGREKPILFTGTATTRQITGSGILTTMEEVKAWEKAAQSPQPFLYRDPEGTYVWGMLSGVTCQRLRPSHIWTISFTITEVDNN